MNLLDLIDRQTPPQPWAEGEKIPWNDPAFSERMLAEHLSQAHDAASRCFAKIDLHVRWLHENLLAGGPTRVLELGCGPGLYTSRLARLGHECVGIDFAPAAIAYAGRAARSEGLACTYHQADIRQADCGAGFGLAMLIFGEFCVFHPSDAELILAKAAAALDVGGLLVLEPHTYESVKRSASRPSQWQGRKRGRFSARPHLYLVETFWDDATATATTRGFIVDAASGDFRVKDGSPALKLGFKNFPMDQFGVTKPNLKAIARTPALPGETAAAEAKPKRDTGIRQWEGARVRNVAGDGDRSGYGLPDATGVVVVDVKAESAAASYGLRKDDVIRDLSGKRIAGMGDLTSAFAQLAPGKEATLGIVRGQRKQTLTFTAPRR